MAGCHTLESALAINTKIQSVLYRALLEHGVFMEGVILKSNIVNPGKQCPVPYRCEAGC
jgi:fructose-bisphosphate aldolase class I